MHERKKIKSVTERTRGLGCGDREGLEVSAQIIHAVILGSTVHITLFAHQSVNASF